MNNCIIKMPFFDKKGVLYGRIKELKMDKILKEAIRGLLEKILANEIGFHR